MREIKFRGLIGEDFIFSECVFQDNDVWRILSPNDDNWWACLEPQQFTGLKDKNGKEIYEGDIVEYDGWFYIIKWDEEETGFYMHDKNNYEDDHLRMIDISVGEVMGNIYENQNLIK
ncbi:YopX family protein [Bacillus thuringiensis]|uniref:YopX family protein n=1 Tax=Bacillus thuringiensis TaxID=1428 RepID=UPI001F0A99DA|nr:YopX family protein [Bacillus thuringiensis]